MRKKIIIVIDNPSRDLAASILIARELAKDHCIYLCSTASLFYEIFRLNPDLVLLNYLRITHLSLIRKLIDCSIQYSVLDTEGGVFAKINEQESSYTKTIVTDARVRNHLLRYYAWGLNLQQELLKNKIYSAQQIRCLGTPRSDFYHLSFMSFYDCPKDSLASQSKQSVILINTSFSLINPKFTTAINEQKSLKEKFNYTDLQVQEMVEGLNFAQSEMIGLTLYLAERFPDEIFIFRAHPFECEKIYVQTFSNHKNILVDSKGSVADQLAKAKALIHFECTTSIEASFMKLPSLSLDLPRSFRDLGDISLLTQYFANKIMLGDFLENNFCLNKKHNETINSLNPTQKSAILTTIESKYFYKVDGKSYQRISEDIRRSILTEGPGPTKTIKAIFFFHFFQLISFMRAIAKFTVKKYLVPPLKDFTPLETQQIFERLQFLDSFNFEIKSVFLSSSIEVKRNLSEVRHPKSD